MFGFSISLSIVFLLFEANTFLEYTLNIYVDTTELGACIAFTAILFKREKLFELINEFVEFVDESEYRVERSLCCCRFKMDAMKILLAIKKHQRMKISTKI